MDRIKNKNNDRMGRMDRITTLTTEPSIDDRIENQRQLG